VRIVSLLSSATEILFGMGLGDAVVGISHECDYPPEAVTRPRLTRSLIRSERDSAQIDAEVKQRFAAGEALYEVVANLLAQLAPDLIITQAQCDVCAVRYDDVLAAVARTPQLSKTRVLALAPQRLADILEDVLRVGEATGAAAAAERFHAQLAARVERVRKVATDIMCRPRVVCIEWTDPLMLAANWTPELIALAGGEAGLVTAGEHSVYAAWEDVRAYDPQVVIISPCGFDLARSQQEAAAVWQLPGWHDLAAVREKRVFVLDGNAYLNRSGPRIVDSLEIIAHFLHPARFAGVHGAAWVRTAP
jgi:iron complex transport system substrate-binding protein